MQPDLTAQSRVLQGLITGIGFVGDGATLKEGMTVHEPPLPLAFGMPA